MYSDSAKRAACSSVTGHGRQLVTDVIPSVSGSTAGPAALIERHRLPHHGQRRSIELSQVHPARGQVRDLAPGTLSALLPHTSRSGGTAGPQSPKPGITQVSRNPR